MKPALDDQFYWRHCNVAWIETFRIQLGLTLTEFQTSVEREPVGTPEVGARLILATNAVQIGEVRCYFSKTCLMQIYAAMVGEADASNGKDCLTAAGEVLNITYATARTKINNSLSELWLPALPLILSDADASFPPKGRHFYRHFTSDFGKIRFEMHLLNLEVAA